MMFHDLPHMACVLSQTPWPLGKVCYSSAIHVSWNGGNPNGSCSKYRHASNKDSKLGCPRPQWNLNCSGFKRFSACGFDQDPPPSKHNLGGSFHHFLKEPTNLVEFLSIIFHQIPNFSLEDSKEPKILGVGSNLWWLRGMNSDLQLFRILRKLFSYPKVVARKIDLSMCYVGPTYSQYLYKTLDRNKSCC